MIRVIEITYDRDDVHEDGPFTTMVFTYQRCWVTAEVSNELFQIYEIATFCIQHARSLLVSVNEKHTIVMEGANFIQLMEIVNNVQNPEHWEEEFTEIKTQEV